MKADTLTHTIAWSGDLTSTNAAALRERVRDFLDAAPGATVNWHTLRLELGTARMVDSVGLNLIVTILRAVQKAGRKMQVAYTNQNVFRTFQFTRLDQHIELIKIQT